MEITTMEKFLKEKIRDLPDWPKEGVIFRDITTVLKDPEAFRAAIDGLLNIVGGIEFDAIAAMESRGFIFGSVIAYLTRKAFIPIRKPGKLPCETVKKTYKLEYGTDTIEMHKDAVKPGMKVLILDDLIATGGSARATADLVEEMHGKVAAFVFLIELTFLHGRDKLEGYEVYSIVKY